MSDEAVGYVFKPMKRRMTVLALGAREWGVVVLVGLAGAALAFALGFWTHEAPEATTSSERQAEISDFTAQRSACKRLASKMESLGVSDPSKVDLGSSDRELVAQAEENGVTAETTDDELQAMTTKTKTTVQPVIPDLPRWLLLLFAPMLAAGALQAELFHNSSISRELARAARNARDQHDFESDPEGCMLAHEEGTRR